MAKRIRAGTENQDGMTIKAFRRGKHLGHALEAHCRALVSRLSGKHKASVNRDLPFGFPVHPDIVVLDAHQKLVALGMVSYCSEANQGKRASDNSSMKFYRTRFEYNAIMKQWRDTPCHFTKSFRPFIVIYGSKSGWKPSLVQELQANYPTTLFLPDVMGSSDLDAMIANVWKVYSQALGARRDASAATLHVFNHFSDAKCTLSFAETKLMALLEQSAFSASIASQLRSARSRLSANRDNAPSRVLLPFRSRWRQGLALASTFTNAELAAGRGRLHSSLLSERDANDFKEFVKRAVFMDLGQVTETQSVVGVKRLFHVRRPEKISPSGAVVYAPERPDFEDWSRLSVDACKAILQLHRALPAHNPRSFGAGALDQIGGNWREFALGIVAGCDEAKASLASAKNVARFLMYRDAAVGVEPWHPSAASAASSRLWWSVFVCAAACVNGDRRIFRGAKVRRCESPASGDAEWLAELAAGSKPRRSQTADLIVKASDFCVGLLDYDLATLAAPRPTLLDYNTATSMSAWWYGALTTNPSYNPLSWVALALAETLCPDAEWQGFPRNRSCRLSTVIGDHTGRVEWSLVSQTKGKVICVEPRSITANNFGNKSKEIFDRIEETRQAARRAGKTVEIVGVLDGDFDLTTLHELGGAHGYDVIYSVEEAVGVSGGALGVKQAGEAALASIAGGARVAMERDNDKHN
jgi:hypothetical protein